MAGDSDPSDLFDYEDGVDDPDQTGSSGPLLRVEKRPRGILSHTDREYLCGLKDYEHKQTEANRRQDIRERIRYGLEDFRLLWWLLNDNDRGIVFEKLDEAGSLDDSLSAAIAFLFLGIDRDIPYLEAIIEDGIYAGANYDKSGQWAGDVEAVNVSIDIDRNPDVEAIYEQFQEGNADQLTPTEVGVLVRAGKIEPDELEELIDTGPDFPDVYFGGGYTVVTDDDADSEH